MTEELLRVEDEKKAVYSSYLAYSVTTDSSVYAYSIRLERIKRLLASKKEESAQEKDTTM